MKSLLSKLILRRVTICVLVVILLACGVLATMDMSINLLPNINMPMLGITFVYPGASASSVEKDVTSVVEDTLRSLTGVTERQTIAYDNVCIVILTFNYGTDIDKKKEEAQELFATVTLPSQCENPIFTAVNMNGAATATVALYSDNQDMQSLLDDAKMLERNFLGIEGVGSVKLIGAPTKQINIKAIDGLELASLLISQALSAENTDIPLGTIMADGNVVSIRNASDATSVLDIMNLPIKMELSSSAVTQLQAVQSAVYSYATCTWQEFLDYKQSTLDARKQMVDMEGMTSAELQEQRDGLGAMKSVMELLRTNDRIGLEIMWNTVISPILPTLASMTDEELQAKADQYEVSYELLEWMRDGAKDGTLESDWNKLEAFRTIVPQEDTNGDGTVNGDDITYQQFAQLFRQGGSIEVKGEVKTFEGLDMVHNTDCAIPDCDKEHMTEEETADACKFAEQVNLAGYDDIIESAKEAEKNQQTFTITDQQFATLFSTVTADEQNAILMSDKVIHIIRADNYETEVLPTLESYKWSHVVTDESSADYGKAVYKNGEVYREDADGNAINKDGYLIGKDGRLVDKDGNYIDAKGNKLTLTEEQKLTYPYTLGEYTIFSDEEYVKLYTTMNADIDMGITPTSESVHFLRVIDFDKATTSGDTTTLLVAVSSLGSVSEEIVFSDYAQYNGKQAIVIEVYANSQANTTDIVNTVKDKLNAGGYEGQAILLSDTAQFITDSISNVLSSIIIGGILAVLIIYLFVRKIGSSLVVSITMPLSVLVALLGMWAMGISLNVVSLGGLAVGIGMLVDNSIVVLESITKYRDKGISVYRSCVDGTAEVGGSLVASTLTNICVFFPILFTQGLTREIFYDLVWAVIYSLVMSLIVAVTVIPTLYYMIYHRNEKLDENNNDSLALKVAESKEPHANTNATVAKDNQTTTSDSQLAQTTATQQSTNTTATLTKRQQRAMARAERRQKRAIKAHERINKSEQIYGKVLTKVLTKRLLVCILALVIFAGSTVMVFMTGMDFMPSVDKGEIEVGIQFDASTTLEDAEKQTLLLKDKINEMYTDNELSHIAVTIGVQGLMATDISGKLLVKLDTSKIATGTVAQDIRKLSQDMGMTGVSVTELDGIVATVTSGMSGMSVSIVGDDLDTLLEISNKLEQSLKDVNGIVSVRNNASQRVEQYSFVIDKYLCAEKNVEYMAVVGLLRVALSKDVVTSLDINGSATDVYVSISGENLTDVNALLDLTVGLDGDGAIKVRDVLRTNDKGELFAPDGGVIQSYEMTQFNKIDGKYVATLDVETYGVDAGSVGNDIEKAVNTILADYEGYEYQESGVTSYLNEAFSGLVVALIFAFLLLYGVMACQFESLIKPLVVIVSIPFSFTGGFLALLISGTTLNVVSFVGIIMLMGVIVNGAIVMIDKIDMLIKEGMTPQEAVIEGCKSRLRPILMTTLTTVLALVPLALGLGDGGELMQPMGIVVLGGLLLGTLVTLVLIPCFYCIVKRIKYTTPKQDTNGSVPTDSQVTIEQTAEQSNAPTQMQTTTRVDRYQTVRSQVYENIALRAESAVSKTDEKVEPTNTDKKPNN